MKLIPMSWALSTKCKNGFCSEKIGGDMEKKKFNWPKIIVALLCLIILVIVGFFGYLGYLYHALYNGDKIDDRVEALKILAFFRIRRFNEVDILGGNLQYCSLEGANLQLANLIKAELQGSDLKGADLEKSEILYANLEQANLEGAKLQEANLQRANLQGANLQDAKLQEANLQDCKNLTVEQICDAKSIKDIRGLSKEFLQQVKDKTKEQPDFMKWWNGKSREMKYNKETYKWEFIEKQE